MQYTQGTMRLPIEVILMIGCQLDHRNMLSLSLTAKAVFEALKTPLRQERLIRNKYRKLDIEHEFKGRFRYHKLLNELLHDDRLAGYVMAMRCGESIQSGRDEYDLEWPEEEYVRRAECYALYGCEMGSLLRSKIAHIPWLSEQQHATFPEDILTGDENAVLTCLLCILTELRSLRPPDPWSVDVQKLIRDVSCQDHAQQQIAAPESSAPRPLSKLRVFEGNAANGVHGTDLDDALDWAGLPRLRRIILNCCRTDAFRRGTEPSGPLIEAPEIYLTGSCVTMKAITEFAKFVRAPCIIRQTFDRNEYVENGPITWDHCEISEDSAGNRTINVELRYPNSELHENWWRTVPAEPIGSPAFKRMRFNGRPDRWGKHDIWDWTL